MHRVAQVDAVGRPVVGVVLHPRHALGDGGEVLVEPVVAATGGAVTVNVKRPTSPGFTKPGRAASAASRVEPARFANALCGRAGCWCRGGRCRWSTSPAPTFCASNHDVAVSPDSSVRYGALADELRLVARPPPSRAPRRERERRREREPSLEPCARELAQRLSPAVARRAPAPGASAHAEARAHAGGDLARQRHQLRRRRAAAVDERERVLGGDARRGPSP